MQISKSTIRYLPTIIWIVVGLFMWALSYGDVATADVYSDSAHGNTRYGVNRSNVVEDPDYPDRYAIGACIHCHGTFDASICGVNPLMLFAPYDENFCFGCHKDSGSYQTGGIDINKSYSCNFGGNADEDTYDTDILSAFSHTTSGSSHWLEDIKSFALGSTRQTATGSSWSLDDNLNPCHACHNVHIAQRNYNSFYDATKSAISRPSDHHNLWGDDANERMDTYLYQPPYWSGSTNYEPDNGSDPTQSKANMPDYPTFCTDCHNAYNAIDSTNPCLPSDRPSEWGSALQQINWSDNGDKHGANAANGGLNLRDPYSSSLNNNVLSCTDCHEPHGSKNNVFLIRTEVNDGNLGANITAFSTADWKYLCSRCHKNDGYYGGYEYKFRYIHHLDSDAPYPSPMMCGSCHGSGGGGGCGFPDCGKWDRSAIRCDHCHFHGSDDSWYPWGTPTYRRTF